MMGVCGFVCWVCGGEEVVLLVWGRGAVGRSGPPITGGWIDEGRHALDRYALIFQADNRKKEDMR